MLFYISPKLWRYQIHNRWLALSCERARRIKNGETTWKLTASQRAFSTFDTRKIFQNVNKLHYLLPLVFFFIRLQ
jgi:hypothetical protein